MALKVLNNAAAAGTNPAPVALKIKCPVYVMEYHIWYRSPFGPGAQPGYVHWGDAGHIDFPLRSDPNMRDMDAVGYPLLGLYNSENPDVIRWQLRCAHNTGIDGLFVQLFPDRTTGTYLGGSKTFATILRIAGEESIKVAAHDEVMFRSGWKAQEPGAMTARISDFIRRYGSDPAYLKISGKPVYAFQYWNQFMPPTDMAACLDKAEKLAGMPIHFLVMGGANALYQRSSPMSFVVAGNSLFIKPGRMPVALGSTDWLELQARLLNFSYVRSQYPKQQFGLWAYPGFNNQPQMGDRNDAEIRSFSRQGGDALMQTLATYIRENPDFIMLSSWNDWLENTAFEPGYRFDAGAPESDPYRYCRLLASMKGGTFTPPPLPPRTAVDPLRWQALYGADSTPPVLTSFHHAGNEDHLDAIWSDSGNPVAASMLLQSGDAWIDFLAGTTKGMQTEFVPERMVSQTGFLLTKRSPLTLHLDPLSTQGPLPEWYLALQFQEQGPGVIKINYSSSSEGLDYREFDGLTLPFSASVKTGGQGLIRTEVSVLRAAAFDAVKTPVITISIEPSAEQSANQEVSAYLRRIDLFHSLQNGVEGKCTLAGTNATHDTNFEYHLDDKADHVFLLARDLKNNWSAPQPVLIGH